MNEPINNPADITEEYRKVLISHWEDHYSKENKPASYFSSLPNAVLEDFYSKLEHQCLQILTKNKGYNQWAYNKYRIDINGNDGVLTLLSEVNEYFLLSSDNDKNVNLKEIFKNGESKINRNLNQAIKRVLVNNRGRTVIDTLLRRIENIADDTNNVITRNRTEENGQKADYFTTVNKFPEERPPTNDEIEHVISLVGSFKETPPKKNAKQASRIYTTKQLVEIMEIICNNLPTDVTPGTLETIFIDLIPDFLPEEFLIEKVFKIYGKVTFPIDTKHKFTINDLDPSKQVIVNAAVSDCVNEAKRAGIQEKCKIIKEHLIDKDLNINTLANEKIFDSRKDVEETLKIIGEITNKLFLTMDDEFISEVAFNIFLDKI